MDFERVFGGLWNYHRGKTIGILIGFLFGLMVVVLGFFEAVFIFLCMMLGFFIGKKVDNNIDFGELMDRIFKDH